ncbi:hypothetical protein GEMRC1_004090 [Eukaryota sp. GEM-RC1]
MKSTKVCKTIEVGSWYEDIPVGETTVEEQVIREPIARDRIITQPYERTISTREEIKEEESEAMREVSSGLICQPRSSSSEYKRRS